MLSIIGLLVKVFIILLILSVLEMTLGK